MLENGQNRGVIAQKRPLGDSRFRISHVRINHSSALHKSNGLLTANEARRRRGKWAQILAELQT
jgi:hypothetical protein